VFLTPTQEARLKIDEHAAAVLKYRAVRFVFANLEQLSANSPLAGWLSSNQLAQSRHIVAHTSDVLRYLLLYKFGGLYLDTDVIVQTDVADIGTNFGCAQSDEHVNNGILKLDKSGGQQLAEEFLT